MDRVADVEVLHEEILVHPTAERSGRFSWKGEARVLGKVVIDGQTYTFERVISVLYHKAGSARGLTPVAADAGTRG